MDDEVRRSMARIGEATDRLLASAGALTDTGVREPSLLPGWTRGHVLTHLCRGADAMRNLLAGARAGQDRPAYASAHAREDDIAQGAGRAAAELMADLAASAMALRAVARGLPDGAWQYPVEVLGSPRFPAAGVLTRRLVEVELHHADLGSGYTPADWPASFAGLGLPEPMRGQRDSRLARGAPA